MSLQVDIEKRPGNFSLKAAFSTEAGTLGLLGASGCGKSMTLKCIAGVETPDTGRIVLNGRTLYDSEKKINLTPQERRVGYLFQNYALFPNMTVRQNILCGLHRERDKAKRESELERVLSLLQLHGLENQRPWQLSGGQAQRTALARIIVSGPELLLLDEPFSALDSHLRERLQLEMKELLANFNGGVLLVTHSRDEAYHLCGRIAVMDEGRLLTVQPTKQLFADPGSRRTALLTGCKNIADARRLSDHECEVPEWGLRLTTRQPLREGLCAVGVRAHYFSPDIQANSAPVQFTGEMEEPFETILRFRWEGQAAASPDLWWRVPKNELPSSLPARLGAAPEDILPLYE